MASKSELLSVGDSAPDFTAPLSDGGTVRLSSYVGHKRVILVFYPGDNTPGCTAQLCALRDDWDSFVGADTVVFGINPAAVARHAGFANRYHLPFPLVIDAGGKIATAYGCRGMLGLIRRTVYVIDARGRVAAAERGTPTTKHLLDTIQRLSDGPRAV